MTFAMKDQRCHNPGMTQVWKFLIPALFLLASFAYAAEVKPAKITRLAFDLIDNRIFVNVYLNDEGPYKFIFDTGGNNSMTPVLAQKLNLPVEDNGNGSGAGSGSQPVGKTIVKSFKVGNIKLADQEFYVMDYSKIQNAFNFKALDGIFGYEILEKYLTSIDFEHSKISFYSDSADFSDKGFERVSFDLLIEKPFIKTTINGIQANTLLDTGDRSALTVTKTFRKNQEIDRPFDGQPEIMSGCGIGGPIPALLARLSTLSLTSSILFSDVIARAPTSTGGFNSIIDLDASIGNEVLKQFNVAFDYRNKIAFFKKNHSFGQSTQFTKVPHPCL
jgi:hypothetical protein